MTRTYTEDELYRALALLHEVIPWIPDSLQDNLVAAERLMQSGLKHLAEANAPKEDICYSCTHMCDIRRRYSGASMLYCVKYERKHYRTNGGDGI